jgi:hypothetical protein
VLSRRFHLYSMLNITALVLCLSIGMTGADEAVVEVTALNYVRAKTALQFDKYLKRAGGKLNAFVHTRTVVGIDVSLWFWHPA